MDLELLASKSCSVGPALRSSAAKSTTRTPGLGTCAAQRELLRGKTGTISRHLATAVCRGLAAFTAAPLRCFQTQSHCWYKGGDILWWLRRISAPVRPPTENIWCVFWTTQHRSSFRSPRIVTRPVQGPLDCSCLQINLVNLTCLQEESKVTRANIEAQTWIFS